MLWVMEKTSGSNDYDLCAGCYGTDEWEPRRMKGGGRGRGSGRVGALTLWGKRYQLVVGR